MKIKDITIQNYKSIKNSVKIPLDGNNFYTFIGKNGSGKTNILKAIKVALSNSRNYYYDEKTDGKIIYHIVLEDAEIDEYFSCVEADEKSKDIYVTFNGANPETRSVDAPIYNIAAKKYREELDNILNNFKKAASKYLHALKEIEQSDYQNDCYVNLDIENEQGSLTRLESYEIERIKSGLEFQIKNIEEYIAQLFKNNNLIVNHTKPFYYINGFPFSFYQIREQQIHISPIVAHSLNLTTKQYETANKKLNIRIKEINYKLKNEYEEINKQLKLFENVCKRIENIIVSAEDKHYTEQDKIDKKFTSAMSKLKETVFRNCYYIDNENSLLFYEQNERRYRDNTTFYQENLNSQNPIYSAFDMFLKDNNFYQDKETIIDFKSLSEDRLEKAIKKINNEFLPSVLAKFDQSELIKFTLKKEENKLKLYVKEKSGENITFSNTSLGRRWYLTYQFIKALLKEGDCLFIDEPAAFLHPQAQIEIKEDLIKLAEKGIVVFITTHSPYMITDKLNSIYNVYMTETGTALQTFSDCDDLSNAIINELGVAKESDILFNLSKTALLVEGLRDKACIETFAKVLHYDISDYNIMPCNGSPILDITYLCINNNIKFKALLDRDNMSKPESWLLHKYGYKQYLEMIKNNSNCIFTPEIGEGKDIEDLFVREDKVKFFEKVKITDCHGNKQTKNKVSIEKLQNKIDRGSYCEETLNNFEHLFSKMGLKKLIN